MIHRGRCILNDHHTQKNKKRGRQEMYLVIHVKNECVKNYRYI